MGLGASVRSGDGFGHPRLSRRAALRAGGIGILGLGIHDLEALRAIAADEKRATGSRALASGSAASDSERNAKSIIYIFLSGGLSQLESFDLKPDAPADIRGE